MARAINPKIVKSEESFITIAGHEQAEISEVRGIGYGKGREIETDEGDFIVFPSQKAAGEAAREYWVELAENDPAELQSMLGDDTLIQWALGKYAGPGSSKVRSLTEWFDLWLNSPAAHWASYDGHEQDVESLSSQAKIDIGFIPKVAYRTN